MKSLTLPWAKHFIPSTPKLTNNLALCVLSKNPNKSLPPPLHSLNKTQHPRICLCFQSLSLFVFMCATKTDCVTTYKEPKYFKYWLLQKDETPFLVLGSNTGIKGEGKWHFHHSGAADGWLLTAPLPFQIPYCVLSQDNFSPRLLSQGLPSLAVFLKKNFPGKADVRMVVWNCTNFITSVLWENLN